MWHCGMQNHVVAACLTLLPPAHGSGLVQLAGMATKQRGKGRGLICTQKLGGIVRTRVNFELFLKGRRDTELPHR